MFDGKDEKIEKRALCFMPSQIQIIGSCRGGWIFLLETNTNDMKLWNPFFNVKICVPYFSSYVIKAATFFGDFFGIGVAVISEDEKLAFVKYGDFKWSYLCGFEAKEGKYVDLISSKDSILALSKNGESIHAWNFEGKNILNVKLDFPQDMVEIKIPKKYRYKLYIAESKGRLFLVIRWIRRFVDPVYEWTVNYYVYIFDEEKRGWSRVENLSDKALVVGKNQTMLLHPKDFEELQKNSIYFAGKLREWERTTIKNEGNGCVNIFRMEDSSIKKLVHNFFHSLFSCWIVSGV